MTACPLSQVSAGAVALGRGGRQAGRGGGNGRLLSHAAAAFVLLQLALGGGPGFTHLLLLLPPTACRVQMR